jgi:hypothetical protein
MGLSNQYFGNRTFTGKFLFGFLELVGREVRAAVLSMGLGPKTLSLSTLGAPKINFVVANFCMLFVLFRRFNSPAAVLTVLIPFIFVLVLGGTV